MDTLRDKRCFITGAASGIGRATALAVAEAGAELYLTDVKGEQLDSTVSEIVRRGGRVAAHRAFDISDYQAVREFAASIHESVPAMDVVMNVAGISIWGSVEDLEHDHWRRVVDVNLMGPIHVIECFVPPMIRAGRGGHLVNVSSAAGLFGLPWHAAYSASKFGLRGISEVLRFDLERHRIGVSLVCPGAVDTPLVGTVQILGLDLASSPARGFRAAFRRNAVSADVAAAAIVRGVLRNEYLVFTSRDVRIGYWAQRTVSSLYERAMRRMNERLHRVPRLRRDGSGSRAAPAGATPGPEAVTDPAAASATGPGI